MSNVVAIRQQGGANNDIERELLDLLAKHRRGDLKSFMHFSEERDGTNMINIMGAFADRLQYAGYTLIKGLHAISEQIAIDGTAGYTSAGPSFSESLRGPPPASAATPKLKKVPAMLRNA